tara:strand:- start:68 stop:205 length:138 start_codon:yes stop_codon:yes gene_type:complete
VIRKEGGEKKKDARKEKYEKNGSLFQKKKQSKKTLKKNPLVFSSL